MKKLWILCLLIILLSCEKRKPHTYSFYYWKTELLLNKEEEQTLNKATTPILYTRFFDVDKIENRFQPVAPITKPEKFHLEKTVVPVVYITNRSFLNIQKEEIVFLAKSINELIIRKNETLKLNLANEIQIDCDWTQGTRDDYFQFLKELKSTSGKTITTTLRLHQVRDKEKMGIPPVEKVYLMCYSTSSPLENSDKNSILDIPLMESYLSNLQEYPINTMDFALPIYSWGVITNHIGKHKLINGLSSKDLENKKFKKLSENQAEVMEDGFYFGHFLNKGFKIKIEEISDKNLDEVVAFLDQKRSNFNLVYYQLDQKFVASHHFNR